MIDSPVILVSKGRSAPQQKFGGYVDLEILRNREIHRRQTMLRLHIRELVNGHLHRVESLHEVVHLFDGA